MEENDCFDIEFNLVCPQQCSDPIPRDFELPYVKISIDPQLFVQHTQERCCFVFLPVSRNISITQRSENSHEMYINESKFFLHHVAAILWLAKIFFNSRCAERMAGGASEI